MNLPTLESLNTGFALDQQLKFVTGPGGFPIAEISNAHAKAAVCMYGGHVVHYQPQGQEPVLWTSAQSYHEAGKPIRGGVPVCWPWFGPAANADLPMHGFARTTLWSVRATESLPDGATRIMLGLGSNADTLALWPHAFDLQITVTVGPALHMELRTENCGNQPLSYSGALHTYFHIAHINNIGIEGCDKVSYFDNLSGLMQTQQGTITFQGETDRVYVDTLATTVIKDAGLGRSIRVAKSGSRSTVVWNPGAEKAKKMPDFGDNEYTGMVCVETANVSVPELSAAQQDLVTLAPGQSHTMAATISVDSL